MISCTRIIGFDAGHRVFGHESKCANLHGHRYAVQVTATPETDLDSIGRVVDFSVIKERVGTWIDENWDHTCILYSKDTEAIKSVSSLNEKPVYVADWNPTAEKMASFLLNDLCPKVLKGTGVKVTAVVVWETPNCFAEASL